MWRALCDRYEVHLVVDEIAVGFGRTGTMFAHQQAGIRPDFICLSKGLTGGTLPLSAVLTTDAVYAAFYDDDVARGFLHSHSYTGNPLACRAALACEVSHGSAHFARVTDDAFMLAIEASDPAWDEQKARAVLGGRTAASIEDVQALARTTLQHRLITNFHAEAEGVRATHIVERLLALVGEELGLLGTVTIVLLFGLFVIKGFQIAGRARHPFGRHLAMGITMLIGMQALVNAGVVTGLLPTKGLTLPFVSYGGSSLVANLFGVGMLLSISRDRQGGHGGQEGGGARGARKRGVITE